MEKQTKSYLHEEVKLTGNLPVWFLPYEAYDTFITNHWHNSLEIIMVEEGCMEVTLAEKSFLLLAGDFYIINSGDIHSTHCREQTKVILLQIPHRFLEAAIPEYDSLRFEGDFTAPGAASVTPILREMSGCFNPYPEQNTELSLKFHALLYNLLSILMHNYRTEVSSAMRIRTERNLKRLQGIMEYVRKHYAEPITLQDGAAAAALDPSYFSRFFKRYMGMTFLEYISSVRLQHFYQDLVQTDYTVTELLERNGFTNYKLFIKLFKETYGCTPAQKRKQTASAI
ncbi:MAG: AraC family transcriptional regulator [Clostridiales bacterium]|nr:AraC family transcriptional regulator [Clostridiales bacterium]